MGTRSSGSPGRRGVAVSAALMASGLTLAGLAGCGSNAPAAPASRPAAAPVAATGTPPHRGHHRPRPAYPLTGLPAPSRAAAARPVLAVKIDNVAGAFPQWGVNDADVVIEEIVEGGLTRLVAAYQSHGAARVGPVRSARPVDADIERLWNGGLLAYSGAAPGEIQPSIEHGHALLLDATTDGTPFYRSSGYAVPHNLFTSTSALYKNAAWLAHAQHKRIGAPQHPLFAFGQPAGHRATRIALVVSPFASSMWRYSAKTHRYLRWQNGTPDEIAGAGQVRASNIVALQVRLKQTSIVDDAGNHDPLDVILGRGKAWVFSRGLAASGTWIRPNDGAPMSLRAAKGGVLHLAPGVTWVELLPIGHAPAAS